MNFYLLDVHIDFCCIYESFTWLNSVFTQTCSWLYSNRPVYLTIVDYTRQYWTLLDLSGLYWTIPTILDYTELNRTVLHYNRLYWTLLDFIRLYVTILDNTRQYKAIPEKTGLYWTIMDSTWLYQTILDYARIYWSILIKNSKILQNLWQTLRQTDWVTYRTIPREASSAKNGPWLGPVGEENLPTWRIYIPGTPGEANA